MSEAAFESLVYVVVACLGGAMILVVMAGLGRWR